MLGVNDRTSGHIVAPDGSLVSRPTTLIDVETAGILRAYFTWAMKHSLEPELFCKSCWDGTRADKAIYNIDDEQIAIICKCQQRVFLGATMPRAACAPSVTVVNDTAGVGTVLLSADAARLLRLHDKHVLTGLALREALRCNACYDLDNPDGCDAQVLSQSIRIACRCSTRTYQGMSL